MQVLLFVLGLVLFLLGLLTGLVNPVVKNPRMGVASHLQGMTNGPLLIVIGLLWPYVHLGHVWQIVTVVLLAYGTYANWLATQLAAIWGAGRKFAPAAAGEHTASPAKEGVIDFFACLAGARDHRGDGHPDRRCVAVTPRVPPANSGSAGVAQLRCHS